MADMNHKRFLRYVCSERIFEGSVGVTKIALGRFSLEIKGNSFRLLLL